MTEFEKVEKLRERANVSYEEAKEALLASEGDLLDAMIYLEKQGKTGSEEKCSYTTVYEEQSNYENVHEKINRCERTKCQKVKNIIRLILIKLRNNRFVVERDGERIISLPLWIIVAFMICSFCTAAIVLVVGLFFDCRYYVSGPDEFQIVNDVCEKAADTAEKVKDEFVK